jgi:DNA-binding CsgD family transcriptional regulator
MVRKPRIHYTETDKAVMWDRWQKGESLERIAQLFDRSHGSVARILRQTGGIRPPNRVRSRRTLSLAEREEISRGVVAGCSLRSIAASLNRAASTISREINRNGGRQQYRATVADQAAWDRDHLSHPLHPGPRGLEEGAVAALATHPPDASFTPPHAKDSRSWPDYRCGVDPGTPGRG